MGSHANSAPRETPAQSPKISPRGNRGTVNTSGSTKLATHRNAKAAWTRTPPRVDVQSTKVSETQAPTDHPSTM
jgi:hypothetical protein